MADMYPRTQWVHAVRAWFDGEIGPEGEQLALPGMPEPPETTAQRAWFLIVADYANPDGYLIAPRDQLQRRWLIPAKTATHRWQMMRQLGWMENVGRAYPGKAQARKVRIPDWAVKVADTDGMGTPTRVTIMGMGTPTGANGYPPQGPPEVGRSEEGRKGASAPPPRCDSHPNGYNHNQPCRACADQRKWDQSQPTPTAPPIADVRDTLHAAVPASDEVRAQALADMVAELAGAKGMTA